MSFDYPQEYGKPIEVLDEGISLTTGVESIDITGTGLEATNIGDAVTVDGSGGGEGDMTVATYDPAGIAEQLVGLTATQTLTNKSIDADNNTLTNIGLAEFDADTADSWDLMNAIALDSPSVTVASDGATITLSLEKSGTGDIRFLFSDGTHLHDCTPADTVSLTAGTDAAPQLNYVYILQSNKTLTASTSAFPSAEHAPIATVFCQSAASLQTDGAHKMHAWTDHVAGSNMQGHLAHLNQWIRNQEATYVSGMATTPTVGGAGVLDMAFSSGVALQLHDHVMPARTLDGTDPFWYVNSSVSAYERGTDLATNITDASGASMSNKYYTLVFWAVISEAEADCKIMVNLPTGSYNVEANAIADDSKYNVYAIPDEFKGTGILLSAVTIKNSGGAGGTSTISQNTDLRGQKPSNIAGGSGSPITDHGALSGLGDDDHTQYFLNDGSRTLTGATVTGAAGGLTITTATNGALTIDPGGSGKATVNAGSGGVDITTDASNSDVTITPHGTGGIVAGSPIFMAEQADAEVDRAGYGQIWVNTATPNELWFTDDAGTDVQLGVAVSATIDIAQTSHGLSVGNFIKSSGTANEFAKAQADSSANAEVIGYVTAVADVNNFTYLPMSGGIVTTGVPAQSAGTVMFLDPSTAGAGTTTEPSTAGQITLPVAVIIESATSMMLLEKRGIVVTNTNAAITKSAQVTAFDYTTDTAVGDGAGYYRIPAALDGMNLIGVTATVITAGTTGTTDVQIYNVTQTADMLSTKVTVDSGETDSDTAATPAVIDTANDDVADADVLRIDVDAVSTTAAKGLIIGMEFQLP